MLSIKVDHHDNHRDDINDRDYHDNHRDDNIDHDHQSNINIEELQGGLAHWLPSACARTSESRSWEVILKQELN